MSHSLWLPTPAALELLMGRHPVGKIALIVEP
jgi:hypothetical protein